MLPVQKLPLVQLWPRWSVAHKDPSPLWGPTLAKQDPLQFREHQLSSDWYIVSILETSNPDQTYESKVIPVWLHVSFLKPELWPSSLPSAQPSLTLCFPNRNSHLAWKYFSRQLPGGF